MQLIAVFADQLGLSVKEMARRSGMTPTNLRASIMAPTPRSQTVEKLWDALRIPEHTNSLEPAEFDKLIEDEFRKLLDTMSRVMTCYLIVRRAASRNRKRFANRQLALEELNECFRADKAHRAVQRGALTYFKEVSTITMDAIDKLAQLSTPDIRAELNPEIAENLEKLARLA
jgi:hypothetical protein